MSPEASKIPAPPEIGRYEHIVLFDGVCNLCNASFRFIYRRDKAGIFRFATVQSDAGQRILEWCGLPTDHYETMIYIEHSLVYQRSDAMLQILRHLPRPWPLLGLARFCPRFVRDGVYNRIARNRYKLFGKRDACLVPDETLASRFL